MAEAKEKTEWQGLQPDLYNIPQGFDKAAALSASKREFESGAQSSGDKVEHKILDFVDTDYILADSDEAALDTLYEAENNRYRARVAELYGTFQKAESELNSDIAKKSAQEQEQRATLDAMTQKKESARAVRDNVDAVLSAYPESMQKDVRTALEKGGKLPEPKALKDKIKVLWNKRKINKSKRNVDEFLQSVQDDAAKEAVFNPEAFDKKIAAAEQDLSNTGAEINTVRERLDAERARLNKRCAEAREDRANAFREKAGNVLFARQLYQGKNAVRAIKLPPMLGMQNLTEPVACAQSISFDKDDRANNIQALVDRMNKAGFKTVLCDEADVSKVADPSVFVIRPATHAQDAARYELLTPFFDAKDARANIKNVMRVVQSTKGATVYGAITPMTLGQMDQRVQDKDDKPRQLKECVMNDPTVSAADKARYAQMNGDQIRDEIISEALKQAYQRGDTQDAVTRRFEQANANGAKYFFRGQAFISGDEMSSYMNPTQRVGRTGFTYASPNPSYAMSYSGAGISANGGSGFVDKRSITLPSGKKANFGFVSVYKASSKTLVTKNFGLEDMKNVATDKYNENQLRKASEVNSMNDMEAHMTPQDNPLAARLLVSPLGVVKIPENDPKWKIICDMYAPDTKDSFKGNEWSEAYGAAYEKRLDALQEQKKAFGKVQTYGKSQEELDALWNTETKVNNEKAPVEKENADKDAMRADFATVLSGKPKEAGRTMPPPLNGEQLTPAPAGAMPPPMPTKGKVVPPPLNGVQMPLAPAGAMPPPLNGEQLTAAPAGAMPPPPPPMPTKGKVVPPPINGVHMPFAPAGAVPPMPKQAGMTMPPPMPTKGKVVPPPLNGVQMPLAPAGAVPPMPKQAETTMPPPPPPMPTKGKVVPPPLNGVQMPLAPAGAMPPVQTNGNAMPPPPPPAQSLQGKLNQMSHKPNLMQTLQSKTAQKDAAPKMPVKQAVRQGESR